VIGCSYSSAIGGKSLAVVTALSFCGAVLAGAKVYSCNCRGLKFDTFECVGDYRPYVEDALEDRELSISDNEEVLELLRSDAQDDNLREYRLRQVESLAEAITRDRTIN